MRNAPGPTGGAPTGSRLSGRGGLRTREIRRASPDFVLKHTGQHVGGVAPVGHAEKIRTLLDKSLQKHNLLWAGAGDHNSMLSITYKELQRITEAKELPVR
ncbi:hypothetical protein DXK94_01045 [Arthrobacter sp. RT-1]|nr:hypothetical protein DXK94_01045 [Arthrobacter sp. RT-1]